MKNVSAIFAAWIFAVAVLSATGRAGADDFSLPELVPSDAGMCIHVRGLARRVDLFQAGPHYARLKSFPPWQKWSEKNRDPLKAIAGKLAGQLGVQPDELWRDVLGREILLAAWPPKPGQRGDGPVLLLVKGENARLVKRVVNGFRQLLALSEGVQWNAAEYAGQEFHWAIDRKKGRQKGTVASGAPTPASGEERIHLAAVGDTIVATRNEAILRRVVDLFQSRGEATAISQSEFYTEASRQVPDQAVMSLLVNPRAWDASMADDVKSAPQHQRLGKQRFFAVWRSLRFWAVSLEIDQRLAVQSVVGYDDSALPKPVGEFLAGLSGPLELFRKVPADCVLAAAGRFQLQRFIQAVELARQETGGPAPRKNHNAAAWLVPLLRVVGPDVGGYVRADATTAEKLEAGATPRLEWVLGLSLAGMADERKEAQGLLQTALPMVLKVAGGMLSNSLLGELAAVLGRQGAKLLGEWFMQPNSALDAFSFRDGYLWAAAAEASITRNAKLPASDSLAASGRFLQALFPATRQPSHAFYLDCAAARRLIASGADDIAAAIAVDRKVEPEKARRGVDRLLSFLALTDTIVAAAKFSRETVAFSLSFTAK